jgi:phage FluMu protein gp41
MKITVEISEADAELIRHFLATTREVTFCTHGPLDMRKLTQMLLEDVALMVRRPGSWEGSNMEQVMSSHGYGSY